MPLRIAPDLCIPDADLTLRFCRASGPGGQNVNKVATKVQLRFALSDTTCLSASEKMRLRDAHPHRLTNQGSFLISCDETRSQETNKERALSRLAAMIRAARHKPQPRLQTKPSRGAKRRRLDDKRARGQLKVGRRQSWD